MLQTRRALPAAVVPEVAPALRALVALADSVFDSRAAEMCVLRV